MHFSFLRCCSQLSAIPSKMHPLLCGFRLWFLQLFWFVDVLTRRGREEGVFSGRGFEEIQKSLKVVSEGSGASLKKVQGGGKKRRRGTRKKRRKMLRWKKSSWLKRGLVHFCVRYAPMVRLAAPSAAKPKTVLMEGQEQLKTESLCLSYSSTNASWDERQRQLIRLLNNMVTFAWILFKFLNKVCIS